MGFLSLAEFQERAPKPLVGSLMQTVGSFDAVARDVAVQISTATGVAIPDDPADAPAWTKGPAAALTFYALLGNAAQVSPELLQWANTMRANALAELERHNVSADDVAIESQIVALSGLMT